jgi:lipopolysaccharide transport system permease protein
MRRRTGWAGLGLQDLWTYRELLAFFVWRNVKVRYKQTLLGAAWAFLQPFFMMVAFTVLFGRIANLPTDGSPRPVFYYAALVPWTYFAQSLSVASESIAQGHALITKVYFPRALLPMSFAFSALVDLAIALVILVGLMAYFGLAPTVAIVLLPAFVALAATFAIGIGLWLAGLNALYRDIRYAVPFLIQVGLFLSPVIYPSASVPHRWQTVYFLNPMAVVIDGFRWALAGAPHPPVAMVAASLVVAFVTLLSGLAFFRKIEGAITDLV